MRRIFTLLLCLCLLPIRAEAVQSPQYVALTFDDGPSGRYTRQLLEGLRERDAKATFLLCGYRIAQYPELTQQICSQGHEIGFHGYSHSAMSTMSRRDIARELQDTRALLPEGCSPVFFRPPGGEISDPVRQVAQAQRVGLLLWSVDPRDWATRDPVAVESAVVNTVRDGDVILLHDMTDSSVRAALEIVDQLKKQGFRFVTVSELARLRDTPILPGKIYSSFPAASRQYK